MRWPASCWKARLHTSFGLRCSPLLGKTETCLLSCAPKYDQNMILELSQSRPWKGLFLGYVILGKNSHNKDCSWAMSFLAAGKNCHNKDQIPKRINEEHRKQSLMFKLAQVIECLLKIRAFTVKKLTANPEKSEDPTLKRGQVSWGKHDGVNSAWKEAKRRAGVI